MDNLLQTIGETPKLKSFDLQLNQMGVVEKGYAVLYRKNLHNGVNQYDKAAMGVYERMQGEEIKEIRMLDFHAQSQSLYTMNNYVEIMAVAERHALKELKDKGLKPSNSIWHACHLCILLTGEFETDIEILKHCLKTLKNPTDNLAQIQAQLRDVAKLQTSFDNNAGVFNVIYDPRTVWDFYSLEPNRVYVSSSVCEGVPILAILELEQMVTKFEVIQMTREEAYHNAKFANRLAEYRTTPVQAKYENIDASIPFFAKYHYVERS